MNQMADKATKYTFVCQVTSKVKPLGPPVFRDPAGDVE